MSRLTPRRLATAGPPRSRSSRKSCPWVRQRRVFFRQGLSGANLSRISRRTFRKIQARFRTPRILLALEKSCGRDWTLMKVMVLGLDGATWDLLGSLAAEGELPNLARLMERGASGTLNSVFPPLSPVAWTGVMTGKNSG